MTDAKAVSREQFLRALTLVKPALSPQAYVPVLSHICFDDNILYAYNDVLGIQVSFPTGLRCAIPGDLLTKLVSSMSSDSVLVTLLEGQALVSGGRSRAKLPILEPKEFVFKLPEPKRLGTIFVDQDFLTGLERCLISVGNDPSRPATMGVTLMWSEKGERGITLYSTDNITISRYEAGTTYDFTSLPVMILPTEFCRQLVVLAKEYKDANILLEIAADHVLALIGDGQGANPKGAQALLFSKFVLDTEPMDFERIISRNLEGAGPETLKIPDTLASAFDRAMLVLDVDKVTKVSLEGKKMLLATSTQAGDVRDQVALQEEVKEYVEFQINPELVARACSVCSEMIPRSNVFVSKGSEGRFLHMIAHIASVR